MIGTIKISQLPNSSPLDGSEDLIVNQLGATKLASIDDVVGLVTYVSSSGLSTVSQGLTGSPDINVTNINASGIVTASGGFVLGISSSGTSIASGPITELNFIGIGNTFAVTGTSVDISIQGGLSTVSQGLTGSPDINVTNINASGIVTASGGFVLGISSSGTSIASGPITELNFIGIGNTFAVTGTSVDISIQGGGESYWSSSTLGIHTLSNVGIATTDPIQKLQVGSAGTSVVVVDDNGNLGLGTTNPTSKIHCLGDVNLDDGGTYTTTLQTITATANRTISFPDATGTVALVAGSNGQLIYNSAGANAGVSGSVVGATGDITLSLNGASDTPPLKLTGTWFSGGTSTTTKPQLLIEPSGTTSTTWSTSGTGLGINASSGFAGNLLDLQVNGTSRARLTSGGLPKLPNLPTYADNTAATSGGLVAGDVYKTATGELRITV